jgi:hypothetical protein
MQQLDGTHGYHAGLPGHPYESGPRLCTNHATAATEPPEAAQARAVANEVLAETTSVLDAALRGWPRLRRCACAARSPRRLRVDTRKSVGEDSAWARKFAISPIPPTSTSLRRSAPGRRRRAQGSGAHRLSWDWCARSVTAPPVNSHPMWPRRSSSSIRTIRPPGIRSAIFVGALSVTIPVESRP